jgi:Tfp pilus assembly protein PilX
MKKRNAFILPGVILVFLLLMIIVPVMVKWVQNDTKLSVKDQRASIAFNLAEAALDRGYWKVKSSTTNIESAMNGVPIPGYNFDAIYKDVTGGTYRISISSIATKTIVIVGEGRDNSTNETRAVSAVFKNQTIYSPLLTGGSMTWKKGLAVFWGSVMSQGDMTLDNVLSTVYYPRKYSKGVVIGSAANPRDINGLNPPNTDGVEWWSDYQYIPELPILDFAVLRASAALTNTLNVYGCENSANYTDPTTGAVLAGKAPWDSRSSCTGGNPHTEHFGNPWNHPKSPRYQPNKDYVWYYDGNLRLTGRRNGGAAVGESTGLRGMLIVRGNLIVDSPGEYSYTGPVPASAWEDHKKLTKTTNDSAATGEYPGDIGLNKSTGTFHFGTDTWAGGYVTTVGMRGFTYVGGNMTITNPDGYMDFNGAVWVQGDVVATGASANAYCGIFYDDTLNVPSLNVVLIRQSWQEITPSRQVWP